MVILSVIMKKFLAWVFVLMLAATTQLSHAQSESTDDDGANSARVLGTISFPTSTESADAQTAFIEGMLLLHLFEYPYARDQFLLAQEKDPAFAMAYWGEAMTYNHPIWDRQELQNGRNALLKLGATSGNRLSKTSVAREKGLLTAVEFLFGSGTKAQRDRAYMRVMEQLAAQFPEDHEIKLFYALSIFGVQAGVRDVPSYMLATALAQSVFSDNPQHPGAAHYLIHGVDDPVHAVLGLEAARALSIMAPDAGHAQHMTSHIFLAVGMWNDVVKANEQAVAVANAMRQEKGLPARSWGHYNFWLLYGLLQQGRSDEALILLRSAYAEATADRKPPTDRMSLDPDRSLVGSMVQMWARYIIDTGSWNEPILDWSFSTGDAFDRDLTLSFIRGFSVARQGEVAQAGDYLSRFRGLQNELTELIEAQAEQAPGDLLYLQRLTILELELQAAIEQAAGNTQSAITLVEQASRIEGEMPYSFGPPFVDLPAAEFLGDLLMASGQHDEAITAYENQLIRTRLRVNTLSGLANSHEKLGNEAEAAYAREKISQFQTQSGSVGVPPSSEE